MPRPARALPLLTVALLGLAQPAFANQDDQPITRQDLSAIDIAKTPVTDLNLDKDKIPEVLTRATTHPYDLTGLDSCQKIASAVQQLFMVLGPDIDIPQKERDRISAGRVAKWVVASFIPFRGIIREISGANEHERKVREAIRAGMARRGFLKGLGQTRGCAYPAAPATKADIERIQAELDRRDKEGKDKDEKDDGDNKSAQKRPGQAADVERTSKGVPIVNQPVVQPVD